MTDDERVSFVGRQFSDAFVRHVVTVPPGGSRPYDESEWRDALVVVEEGDLHLEDDGSGHRRFPCGSVLHLGGLALRALRNEGTEPVVLVAVSRRARP